MPRKLNQKSIEEIYKLFEQGCNSNEVSRIMGVAHSTAIKYGRRNGESETLYRERLLLKNGGGTLREHKENIAKSKGFESDAHYQKVTTSIKKEKDAYKKLSCIVSQRMEFIKHREKFIYDTEVAKNCGLTKQTLSAIKLGKLFPREEYLDKLCSGLKLKKSALEKILKTF